MTDPDAHQAGSADTEPVSTGARAHFLDARGPWRWVAVSVLILVAVILAGGLAWPGWWRTASSAPAGGTTATPPAVVACQLLGAEQVGGELDRTGLIGVDEADPAPFGIVAHLCQYGVPGGPTIAVLEVTDFPRGSAPSATVLVQDVATTGTGLQPVSGISDAAAFVNNLGGHANRSLITVSVSTTTGAMRVVAVTVPNGVLASDAQLLDLARYARTQR
jgi:hypothetical protein